MPSPVGHMLAGTAVGLCLVPLGVPPRVTARILVSCALLAAAPDLDLVLPGTHRTFTHSLAAVGLTAIGTALVSGLAPPTLRWRIILACTLAYASHLVMDFFGVDRGNPAGIQLLWPIRHWYISDLPLFFGTVREDIFSVPTMVANARAVIWELAVLGSLVWWSWIKRRRVQMAAMASSRNAIRRLRGVAGGDSSVSPREVTGKNAHER